jgi:ribosome recycling factor
MELKLILNTTEDGMKKALEHCKVELGKLRTGRASTSMLESVQIDYYGTITALSQVGSVSAPDAHTILIQPWEKNLLGQIERAIIAANLGFSPNNDGSVIRLVVPPLTEERRKEIVKMAKKIGEESKIGVRNSRRDGMEDLKNAEKEGMSEDTRKEGETSVQKLTDKYILELEKALSEKEKEIMTV